MKTRIFMKLAKAATKQSPTILAVMGAIGAITAVGLAIYATKKSVDDVNDFYEHGGQDLDGEPKLTKKQIVQMTWKNYIPCAVLLVTSVACIIGSNSINLKRNAVLMSSYMAVNEKFKDYKDAAREVLGDKKEKEVQDKSEEIRAKRTWNQEETPEIFETGLGNTLCYDDWTGRLFKCDIQSIRKAINDVNYNMTSGRTYEVSLNEFYQEINLRPTGSGRDFGFTSDRLMDPLFSSILLDSGQPCVCLDVSPGLCKI